MKPFRFLHAADLHLDSPFRGLQNLPLAVRERVRGATFSALDKLTELALRERVDFVLIAGDVYDAADRSLRAQVRFRDAARQLAAAGIPLYVVHGNHDPEDGHAAKLAWPDSVRVFSSREVECAPVCDAEGELLAQVYGQSFAGAAVTDNLAAGFVPKGKAPYRIALLHANVDGAEGYDNYAPCSLRQLAESGFDYWALGHVHERRVLLESPFVVYPGNVQGRSVKETGAKGCCLVEVGETGRTQVRFCALDDVRWFQVEHAMDGQDTEEQLLEGLRRRMDEVREKAEGRAAMVRLMLSGPTELHASLRKPGMVDELAAELREDESRLAEASERAAFVWIESIRLNTRLPLDLEELRSEGSFLGDLLREIERLGGDVEALGAIAREAMEPLAASPRLSRWLREAGAGQRREWLGQAETILLELLAGKRAPGED